MQPRLAAVVFKIFCQPLVQPEWDFGNHRMQITVADFMTKILGDAIAPVGPAPRRVTDPRLVKLQTELLAQLAEAARETAK